MGDHASEAVDDGAVGSYEVGGWRAGDPVAGADLGGTVHEEWIGKAVFIDEIGHFSIALPDADGENFETREILNSENLPKDKTEPIVLYCRSGSMSGQAATELADAGYSNIIDLKGGMNAWTGAGREFLLNGPD